MKYAQNLPSYHLHLNNVIYFRKMPLNLLKPLDILLKLNIQTSTSILQILSRAQHAQANLSNLQRDADIQATALKTFTDALQAHVTDEMLITEEEEAANQDQQS